MPESLGGQLAGAFGEVLQRSTRARIYGEVTQDLHEAIDETTYPVISALARLGPCSAAQLAAEIGIDRSVVSRHASRLQEHGLIRREPDPADGRATLLTLTAAGTHHVQTMRARLHAAFDGYLAGWPADRARAFVEDFVRFVAEGPFATTQRADAVTAASRQLCRS